MRQWDANFGIGALGHEHVEEMHVASVIASGEAFPVGRNGEAIATAITLDPDKFARESPPPRRRSGHASALLMG